MKFIIVLLIILMFIILICLFNYLINRRKRDAFIKAGKKWDGIVKELSRRK